MVARLEGIIGRKLGGRAEYDGHGRLFRLNLMGLGLGQVPAELGQLSHLQELYLNGNDLSQLPAEIGLLSNLQGLTLNHNQLSQLPPEFGRLSDLQILYLNNNQLSQLPPEFGLLSNLRTLRLNHNQLNQIPAEFGQLSNLHTLDLNHNRLSQIPAEIGQLSNLRTLYLNNSRLSQIPAEIGLLSPSISLNLIGNPSLLTPPPEIIAQGTLHLLAFLRELRQQSVERYEAKLILVGEGGTGKSSLLRALHGKPFVDALDTTHGIEVDMLSLPHPSRNDKSLTLNTWDFGGQEIYRATHQFFLTKRSLYLVVWNARTEATQGKLDYWLKTIHLLAPDAPIVLVATHIDERKPDLDEQQYRKAYPQIVDIAHASSKSGKGIDHLKAIVAQHAVALPLMGQRWPQSWIEVEQALLSSPFHHISINVYMKLCSQKGIYMGLAQGTPGNYLHDLGRILYFMDDPILKNIIVLKPNWITKTISWILEDKVTDKANGILMHADLPRIWAKDEDGVP
jgi:internalin A